ncbi:MAG: C1 family peptidase, partial [Flavobacteriales bacterium]
VWIASLLLVMSLYASSQTVGTSGPYTFSIVKENVAGAVENQCQTGTCWSFATVSFLEAEILRKGGKAVDISEMYNVRIQYPRKADAYVRYQGKQQFGPGGLSHDVLCTVAEFGIVPESA